MNIITVEVVCPATSRSYDYKLPVKMKAGDIKLQMIEDIRLFEGISTLFGNENDIHIYTQWGCIADGTTPEYAGVRNGDKLMII